MLVPKYRAGIAGGIVSSSPKSSKHWPRPLHVTLIAILCSGYVVGMIVFVASRVLPRRPPSLVLADVFTPFLFAPLILVLPLALLSRSKAGSIGSLIVLGLFLAIYGPFFLPSLHLAAVHANSALTAMTFNLGPDQPHPEWLVSAIEDENAGIVAVQELKLSTAELIRQRLGGRYPQMVLEPSVGSVGLMSRYPILKSHWFQPAEEGRLALYALLDVNGTEMHVLVLHPRPPVLSWYRDTRLLVGLDDTEPQRQVIDVAWRADDLEGPVLVMGDLNLSDQTRAYARLSRVLKDTWREVGWGFGFTFPRGLQVDQVLIPGPWVRIDYVFHSPDIRANGARVACRDGSDHCYLVTRFAFPQDH
jgi:endonuclease/exonuclease/phosphatase (EEP) superfamily protein YafD